jgi:hypothetical protein
VSPAVESKSVFWTASAVLGEPWRKRPNIAAARTAEVDNIRIVAMRKGLNSATMGAVERGATSRI